MFYFGGLAAYRKQLRRLPKMDGEDLRSDSRHQYFTSYTMSGVTTWPSPTCRILSVQGRHGCHRQGKLLVMLVLRTEAPLLCQVCWQLLVEG